MQVSVAYVRAAVSLHSQRHETVFANRPALIRFGLLQARALQLLSRARSAGDERNGALPRVRLAFLSPGAAVPAVPAPAAASVTVTEGMPFSRAGPVLLAVLCGRGNLAGVRAVFEVSIFAFIVAVLVAVTEIWQRWKGESMFAYVRIINLFIQLCVMTLHIGTI